MYKFALQQVDKELYQTKHPVYTGETAAKSLDDALSISPEARSYLQSYLKDRFGVELK